MYEVRCYFCKRIHRSEYFDVIEEEILACRERAHETMQGRLESYEGKERPVKVETEGYTRSRSEAGVAGGP